MHYLVAKTLGKLEPATLVQHGTAVLGVVVGASKPANDSPLNPNTKPFQPTTGGTPLSPKAATGDGGGGRSEAGGGGDAAAGAERKRNLVARLEH